MIPVDQIFAFDPLIHIKPNHYLFSAMESYFASSPSWQCISDCPIVRTPHRNGQSFHIYWSTLDRPLYLTHCTTIQAFIEDFQRWEGWSACVEHVCDCAHNDFSHLFPDLIHNIFRQHSEQRPDR